MPYYNVFGIDPLIVDPEGGDWRLQPGSPAEGYGCLSFPGPRAKALRPPETAFVRSTFPGPRAIDVAGLIDSDTVWDADTVRVQGDVEVADGATLSIAAGTCVEFQDHYSLTVFGCLLAIGQPEACVHFTSDEPGAFAVDSTLAGAWAGIRFPFTSEINGDSRLEYCIVEFAKNAGDSCRGGALQVQGFSKLSLVNTILRNNVADFGGAVVCTHEAAPELIGCLLVDNVAFNGGAVLHCLDASPKLSACTIVGNFDLNPQIFDPSAAVYAHISKPVLTGCILRDNFSLYFVPTEILYGKSYCTTWNNIGEGWPGEGNIDADPFFVGAGPHPYALTDLSPCRDGGPPDTTGLNLPALDLAGAPRLGNGRVDMGAYEWAAETGVPVAAARARLLGNHPNPFNPRTLVEFELAEAGPVRLEVFDPAGRRVRLLVDANLPAGPARSEWDGRDDAGRDCVSGVYLLKLTAGAHRDGARMVLLK